MGNTATAIDYIIINTVLSSIQQRPARRKTNISDHFQIVFVLNMLNQKIMHNLFINASTEKNK